MTKNEKKKKEAGFTLIEVVAAVAIIGLLATMAIPTFGRLSDRAKDTKLQNNLATLDQAIVLYNIDKGVVPETLDSLKNDYISENSELLDAKGAAFTYTPSEDGTKYVLKGNNSANEEVESPGSSK